MPTSKTETALISPAMDMALTLDQLVAPLEVPAAGTAATHVA